jgi:hypothetical protein
VPNVVKIWEPKPPGTLWATPGLLQDFLLIFDHEDFIDLVSTITEFDMHQNNINSTEVY